MIYDISISFSHVLDVDSADRSDRFSERFCRTLKSSLQNVWRRRGWRFEDIFIYFQWRSWRLKNTFWNTSNASVGSWCGLPILLISFELGCQGFLGIEHFDDPFFHWTYRSCPISMRERTRRKRKTRRKPHTTGIGACRPVGLPWRLG